MATRSVLRKPSVSAEAPASTAGAEVRIFVSYSHKDEVARAKLEIHLAQLKRDGVSTWFDGDLNAGEALDTNIARQLRRAHVFVALLSPDYLASTYCWDVEYKRAMGRRARGTMRVIAVLLRPCDWRNTRAAHFKLLPKDGRPVSEWRPADKAFLDTVNGIRSVVAAVRAELTAARNVAKPKAEAMAASTEKKKKVTASRKTGSSIPKTPLARGSAARRAPKRTPK